MTSRTDNRILRRLADQRGFTMLPAMMAMVVGTLLSLGAWAAANSDIKQTDNSRWTKIAYQKAQSGVSDYVQRVAEDSGFWNQCDQPTGAFTGDGLGQTAINDADFGTTSHPIRRWLPYATAGSATDRAMNTQYTIDLIPAVVGTTCKPNSSSATRMIDPVSGTFRISVTGRAGPMVPATIADNQVETWRVNNWKRVTMVVEFRRNGFLDYAYFTDHEGRDPALLATAYQEPCNGYYQDDPGYPGNPDAHAGRYRNSNCTEIQFAAGDELKGPVHTNDSTYVAATDSSGPLFGNPNKGDRIEIYDNGESGTYACPFRTQVRAVPGSSSYCRTTARLNTGTSLYTGPAAKYMDLPESNDDLELYADPNSGDPEETGYTFYGPTTITLINNGTFNVVNSLVNSGTLTNYPYPTSGVIYVKNNTTVSCLSNPDAKYPGLVAGCALLEVKGQYNKSLTLGSEADVVINGNLARSGSQTAVLGLIANQYVRIRHYGIYGKSSGSPSCTSDSYQSGTTKVSSVTAAILTLNRSFTVDAYSCGSSLGDLTITGSIAQRWRGTVGQGSAGYTKDYNYDYTLKSQSPPRFLAPTAATWKIIRMRQQVPACGCRSTG